MDRDKFITNYKKALDILTNKLDIDVPILQATCDYSSNSEGYLAYGVVNYLFEMDDDIAYVLQYSCINDAFTIFIRLTMMLIRRQRKYLMKKRRRRVWKEQLLK